MSRKVPNKLKKDRERLKQPQTTRYQRKLQQENTHDYGRREAEKEGELGGGYERGGERQNR